MSTELKWVAGYFSSGYACEECDTVVHHCYIQTGVDEEGTRQINGVRCESCNEHRNAIRDTANEMKDWGIILVHNYASGEWEMLEDKTGYFTYESCWSGKEWIPLKEHFEEFKTENPDRYNPYESSQPTEKNNE